MRGHLQRDRDVAAAEDLDRCPWAYRASRYQVRYANRATVRKQLAQPIQVHYLVFAPGTGS